MAQVLASLLADPTGQQGSATPGQAPQGGLNMANLAAGAAGAMALVNMFKSSGLGDQFNLGYQLVLIKRFKVQILLKSSAKSV
jgi:uncharacterized protein YidB (DUF937 family)